MSYRFHLAARDGKLDVLKETTRKDCNSKDDDGMTPTLWSAFEGNLEALRLLVGRGGDPEKHDNYGNTALHFAAARGHMNCVTFLMNYGVNLYAKDIDYHTAKELAALNDHQDILRYLDEQMARHQRNDPKKVKAQMDKAAKDVDKLVKEFAQVQEKARKYAEKEKKRLEKERQEMERAGYTNDNQTAIPRPSLTTQEIRRDSRLIYSQSKSFSEIVNPKEEKDKIKLPRALSGVHKKVQQQRKKMMTTGQAKGTNSLSKSSSMTSINNNGIEVEPGDFKIRAVEDGKLSVRSISGIRRDSEILYVPQSDETNAGRRTGLDNVFPKNNYGGRSKSVSAGTSSTDSGFDDDKLNSIHQHRASLFDRPGFGGLAFRNSIAALGDNQTNPKTPNVTTQSNVPAIDEATRLNYNRRQHKDEWERDEFESDDDDDEEDATPISFFLAAVGLGEFIEPFLREKIDLDSLMLIKESDMISMKIPLGPRRTLMKAIEDRRAALENPDEMEDSHL